MVRPVPSFIFDFYPRQVKQKIFTTFLVENSIFILSCPFEFYWCQAANRIGKTPAPPVFPPTTGRASLAMIKRRQSFWEVELACPPNVCSEEHRCRARCRHDTQSSLDIVGEGKLKPINPKYLTSFLVCLPGLSGASSPRRSMRGEAFEAWCSYYRSRATCSCASDVRKFYDISRVFSLEGAFLALSWILVVATRFDLLSRTLIPRLPSLLRRASERVGIDSSVHSTLYLPPIHLRSSVWLKRIPGGGCSGMLVSARFVLLGFSRKVFPLGMMYSRTFAI